jgi:2-octaprenyl-6-methoxyphenol hydroxylase
MAASGPVDPADAHPETREPTSAMSAETATDCIVVGTGAAGLTAALGLAAIGLDVALIGPPPPTAVARDTRTAALFQASIELLKTLGVWPQLEGASAPLAAIRLIDDTDSLLRAPEVLFRSAEAGLAAFGFNVPNAALVDALAARAAGTARITWSAGAAARQVRPGADSIEVITDTGARVAAPLLIAADGRRSICREAAGIGVETWDYPQTAIATAFAHSRPHHDISTEFHRQAGPCTTVPMPGRWSSLVWVERPAIATRLAALPQAEFRAALDQRLNGLLGTVGEIGPVKSFPLGGLQAASFGRSRVALIGEAAHAFPPIGAQGLNLGLRDVAALVEAVATARRRRTDIGADEVLEAYSAARARDVASRTTGVDLLNRSLLTEFLPAQLARGAGLHALKTIAPLRRWAISVGMSPPGPLPRLMQPGGGGLLAGA